jgi:hypothetical protein
MKIYIHEVKTFHVQGHTAEGDEISESRARTLVERTHIDNGGYIKSCTHHEEDDCDWWELRVKYGQTVEF